MTVARRRRHEDCVSGVFAALADPIRRDLLVRLVQGGPSSATVLARGATVSRQAITKHLQVLADAGLVSTARTGREVQYRPADRPPADAIDWLESTRQQWDRRLDRLARQVEAARDGSRRSAVAP